MRRELHTLRDLARGIVRRSLRRRQIAKLHAEMEPHLLYDIGLLDAVPATRRRRG